MAWDLTIRADPGTSVGEYLCLLSGSIDGSQCYLGLQTDIDHPRPERPRAGSQLGRGIGKGLIFSTWWSFDAADTRLAPDGFRQLGTHEGRFVGVRRPYEWTEGDYRVTLERSEEDLTGARPLDWFDLWVQRTEPGSDTAAPDTGDRPRATSKREWMGGMRFPRARHDRRATIDATGTMFLEIYSRASTWASVPHWSVDLMAFGDGRRCPGGRNEYPAFPHGQLMPNANVGYRADTQRVSAEFGAGVVKRDRPDGWRTKPGTGARA